MILKYDDDQIYSDVSASAEVKAKELEEYKKDSKNYAAIPFKLLRNPTNGWATPFVTGHKYKFHFGNRGIDWEKLEL